MGIFSRFRDIVSSNLNSILDRAEDPQKMVRLIIQEMEDTLIEVKSSCAGVIADQKKTQRELAQCKELVEQWDSKAKLAVSKGRDDLARAALSEKRKYNERADWLTEDLERTKGAVSSFQSDITQLESKLNDARDKQRSILQRRAAVDARRRTHSKIRKVDTSEAFMRFEAYEYGIDRMEAEAELTDSYRPKEASLDEKFTTLEHEDEIEQELEKLRKEVKPGE